MTTLNLDQEMDGTLIFGFSCSWVKVTRALQ